MHGVCLQSSNHALCACFDLDNVYSVGNDFLMRA